MSQPLQHRPSDPRTVWVFTVDLPPAELSAFAERGETWPLSEALGNPDVLDPDFVEAFPASELRDYGLDRYLAEANGFEDPQLAEDAARLRALQGNLALVYSRAFSGTETTLAPRAPLTFVGRYEDKSMPPPPPPPLPESAAASGTLGPAPAADPGPSGRRPRGLFFWIVMLAIVALGLALWSLA